ncbi:MAG: TetR/AcrR family transcriptional regulator [Akkermansiaceae bacterium]|nr:TetR/AcrR family transcriptional regulator [Akkermansiaceae bacterium]
MAVGSSEEKTGTRERILEAAEGLFAERGFEVVSLRDITSLAGANVAAVNYHFGSKEKLVDAVVERHATPVNRKRMAMLDEAEERHAGGPVPVREILEAFLNPLIEHISGGEREQQLFCKFMGRLMGERGYRLPESVEPMFQAMAARFSLALQKAVPELSEELALWRMHFSFGVMANTLMHGETLRQISAGRAGNPTVEVLLERIIDFCTAGFHAPAEPGRGDG